MDAKQPAPDLATDLEQQADACAARGEIEQAARLLEQCTLLPGHSVDTWLKLAAVRRAKSDLPGALAAVSSGLRIDPLHFVALLTQARLLESRGDEHEAARAYTRALAQMPDHAVPPAHLAPLVAHAQAVSTHYTEGVDRLWESAIAAGDLTNAEWKRVERFKTNALRRTRAYHSEPTHYHYPGLPEREFHDRERFPWLTVLEAATASILAECRSLIAAKAARAEPYIQYEIDKPLRQWEALNQSLDWTAFHLLRGGQIVRDNADQCPETMAVLAQLDQPRLVGRSPNAMFSLLKPHTTIPPHTGVANTRLVCHLPLIIPPGCWFRVGAERREWRVGEAFVFDDTIEHEAANESDLPRVVLIIDTWHPDLSANERAAVTRVMDADEAENGAPL